MSDVFGSDAGLTGKGIQADDALTKAPGKSKRRAHAVSDGRRAALEVLLLLEQGIQVQAALDTYLRNAALNPRDKGLCTELVYGYLRAEIRCNWLLRKLLRKPEKLPREMFLALGLALYALLFLERIPAHATVDWTVGHVRQRFGQGLASVANGALRSFLRWGDAPKEANFYGAGAKTACTQASASTAENAAKPSARALKLALERDSLFFSMPFWIARLWENAYGPEICRQLLARSFSPPHACVRVNAKADNAAQLRDTLLAAGGEAMGPWGIAFAAGKSPRSVCNAPLSYWQQQGALSFQSAGSLAALQAMEPQVWTGPVWDMCAGQGGKSCALLEEGIDVRLCTDSHRPRLESFTGNIRRLRLSFANTLENADSLDDAPTDADLLSDNAFESDDEEYFASLDADTDTDKNDADYAASARPAGGTKAALPLKIHTNSLCECLAQASKAPSFAGPCLALADARDIPEASWPGTILIDAPCSGLGVLHRRPDIRRARSAASVEELCALQTQLLNAAWNALLPGGMLIYMTCTLNPAENHQQIEALLLKYPDAQMLRQWQSPHDHPWLEGMYAACCVKG